MAFLVMASAGTVCFASMSLRSPLKSQQIYVCASFSPRISHKMKAIRVNGAGGGDHTGATEKAKYKGTLMREKQLSEMIEKMVAEAKETCQGDASSDECKVAWDEVEEVSSAKADLRFKLEHKQDPLESFCNDNPETDECRIYED